MYKMLHILTRRLAPTIIRLWVVLWVLLVPLFHVHPEVTGLAGKNGVERGGTVHTVFSGDLDGEFDLHEAATHRATDKSPHLSHAWFEHSELVFSLFTGSHHRTDLKPILAQTMVMPIGDITILHGQAQAEEHRATVPATTLFVHEFTSRAPPSLLL